MMRILIISTMVVLTQTITPAKAQLYVNNKAPLKEKPYIGLPLGQIKAKGWLHEMLVRQKDGATGRLDELYPLVMGKRNGWLGGDGDQWERGPYWIDGLLPLAYVLDDEALKKKVQPWVEWAISSQESSGYFGPQKEYGPEKGLQRNNTHDWWPKMVMLKVLQQYYSATGDKRVIELMRRYFRYQLQELPKTPLGHWTFWGTYRSGDNLQAVYWLYNITGEAYLLELADLLHEQGYDFTHMFTKTDALARLGSIHGVNLAQGIKEPIVYYQQHPEQRYIDAVKKGFADIRKFNGQPQGMYGADELLHGNNPTQGSELCSAVELMFSLEQMLEITGDLQFADHLERVAYNALPAQISDDFMTRQYFQQANQVNICRQPHNFDINHGGTDLVFGFLTGYPCCTSNMHQGWPKFVQNLWYATADRGVAALVYGPCSVRVKVADDKEVEIVEDTHYPFDESIRFSFRIPGKGTAFPFHLRIPSWCQDAQVLINGKKWDGAVKADTIAVISRTWKSGDKVELRLPMQIKTSTWYENAVAVERGPLVYALKIAEEWKHQTVKDDKVRYGDDYYEVLPRSPWNYGILDFKHPSEVFTVQQKNFNTKFPWTADNAPIEIKAKAKLVAGWKLYNGMAGPIPYTGSVNKDTYTEDAPVTEITLIPYGCTTLRISEFPVVR